MEEITASEPTLPATKKERKGIFLLMEQKVEKMIGAAKYTNEINIKTHADEQSEDEGKKPKSPKKITLEFMAQEIIRLEKVQLKHQRDLTKL